MKQEIMTALQYYFLPIIIGAALAILIWPMVI